MPVAALHLVLKVPKQLTESKGHDKVDDTGDDQRLDGQVGGAPDLEILGHQVANEEGGGQRGILDDHDEFIAQGRKNVLDRLRHDNEPHSAPFAKAEAKRRFPLTGIDRLNAGTNNLRDIGGTIADKSNGNTQELLLIEGGYQHGQSKVEEIQLQQHGGTADHLDVDGGKPAQRRYLGHLHEGQQRSKHHTAQHRNGGKQQCVADAINEVLIPIFEEDGCHLLKIAKFSSCHMVILPLARPPEP